jgi:hypothetical protein
MSVLEKFFTFSLISTFAVAFLATWWRYVPGIVAYYRKAMTKYRQPGITVNS